MEPGMGPGMGQDIDMELEEADEEPVEEGLAQMTRRRKSKCNTKSESMKQACCRGEGNKWTGKKCVPKINRHKRNGY